MRRGKIEQGGLVDDMKNRELRALSLGEPEGFAKPGFGGRAAVEGQCPSFAFSFAVPGLMS